MAIIYERAVDPTLIPGAVLETRKGFVVHNRHEG
jgi:hypothetical protein